MASILLPFDTNRWDAKEWDLNPHSDLFVGLVACAMPTPEVGLRGLPIDGTWTKTGADGTYGTLRDFLGGQAWMPTNSSVGEFGLTISQSLLTAAPISLGYIGVRFQNYGTTTINIMGVENSASGNNRDRVSLLGQAINKVSLRVASSSTVTNGNPVSFPIGIVSTAVGVYASTTNHWIAAAGQKATTNTTSMAPTGMNRLFIGSRANAAWANALKAGLWWNRALDEAEAIELSRDYRVLFRPKKRILYFGGASNTPSAAGSGTLTLTGSAADGIRALLSAADASSLTLAGSAADGILARLGIADSGSLSLTGSAADALRALAGVAGSGSITLTGSDAAGVYTPVGDTPSAADSGSLTLTGSAAVGTYDRLAAADSGSLTLTGVDAAGQIQAPGAYTSDADTGSLTLVGYAANGVFAGAVTLTQADLDAIAAAMWADPAAVAAHAKLDEIIARITC